MLLLEHSAELDLWCGYDSEFLTYNVTLIRENQRFGDNLVEYSGTIPITLGAYV